MGLGRVWMRKLSVLSVVVGAGLAIGALGMASGCSSSKKEDSTSDLTDESLGGGSGSLGQFNKTGQAGSGGRFEDVYFSYDSADLDGAGTQATRANATRRQCGAALA